MESWNENDVEPETPLTYEQYEQYEQEISQCLLKPLRLQSRLLLQHSLAHTDSKEITEMMYRKNVSQHPACNKCPINIIAIIVIPHENTKNFPPLSDKE